MIMTFGSRITAIRKKKKLSQSKLGKIAGTSGDIIGKYERDEMKPSIDTATRLAAALEVSLDYLVGQSDSEIFDKSLLRRLEELVSLPDQDHKGILFALDGLLRDAKTRHAYAAS
jgi:transcriptional regulator with XRE-family HTH domain